METTKVNNRHYIPQQLIVRAAGEGTEGKIIEGYASVFEQRSKIIYDWYEGYFYEVIERGAFDEVLASKQLNVIATVNHMREKMLGRTKSGTLRLSTDDKGLRYEIDVPNTTLGNDTLVQIERGDFYESSFIYTVEKENIRWDETEEGIPIRYIKKVRDLFDVAVVTDGAFANTDVSAAKRALEQYRQAQAQKYSNLAAYQRKLMIRKHKNL